jgi:hypothetical protein
MVMNACGAGDENLTRLVLGLSYLPERPDPDFLMVKVRIDGQELLTWQGRRARP